MIQRASHFDVAVIGGGVTGLMASSKLSSLGMRVILVEREAVLAGGPSTRNEGWLHRGTYHANSVRDRTMAIQVAKRCIYGHEQIRSIAPESVEDIGSRTFAMVRDAEHIPEVVERWTAAGVRFQDSSLNSVRELFPKANISHVAGVYEVADVSIDTTILYRKLLTESLRNNVELHLKATIDHIDGMRASIVTVDGKHLHIEADVFVYAAGFGARTIFAKHFRVELEIRYWKSHLVILPRLGQAGLFYLEPHEAAIMHHGERSIVGLNEDAMLSAEPNYSVSPDIAGKLHRALDRLVPGWSSSGYEDIACTKSDLAPQGSVRSLNIAICEPVPGHFCILPGKMTEAPFLTDKLVQILHVRLQNQSIAKRPCDLLSFKSMEESYAS